jgi:hypothetical protein
LLETEAKPLSTVRAELERHRSKLKALDNPRSKIAILENEARRESEVRENLSKTEKNLERLESDRRIHIEQLEAYKDLDKHWAETGQIRERQPMRTKPSSPTKLLRIRFLSARSPYENAKRTFEEVSQSAAQAEKRYSEAGKGYDREHHLTERSELLDLQKRMPKATLRMKRRRNANRNWPQNFTPDPNSGFDADRISRT